MRPSRPHPYGWRGRLWLVPQERRGDRRGGPGTSWTASCRTTLCGSTPRAGSRSRRRFARCSRAMVSRASIAIRLSTAPRRRGGNALLREIETLIARFPPYSEEREQFSAALYGTSEVLKIDGEGRAILTEPLKLTPASRTRHVCRPRTQVSDSGAGRFRAELAEATEKVRALKRQLGSRVAAEGPHGARE